MKNRNRNARYGSLSVVMTPAVSNMGLEPETNTLGSVLLASLVGIKNRRGRLFAGCFGPYTYLACDSLLSRILVCISKLAVL